MLSGDFDHKSRGVSLRCEISEVRVQ